MKKPKYFSQFHGFGIADRELEKMKNLPLMMFGDEEHTVVVGVLMGRESEHYCLQQDYVIALDLAGARVMFLDYKNYLAQLPLCDALLLPGGIFDSPEWYYADARADASPEYPSERAKAYAECFHFAQAADMPVLGICAGMQVICAEMGMKLYPSFELVETPLQHKTLEPDAHYVQVFEGTAFSELMDCQPWLKVNSRHSELLAPERIQREQLKLAPNEALPLQIYGKSNDGIIEAIGDMEHGVLGVQWHPENLAVAGDNRQKKIFKWLVAKGLAFKHSK